MANSSPTNCAVAVHDAKPILNRNDWYLHQIDHIYQTSKMSEFKKTVPISEIRKQELKSRPSTTFHANRNSLPPLSAAQGNRKQHKHEDEKCEQESKTNPVKPDKEEKENDEKLSVKIDRNTEEDANSHPPEDDNEAKEDPAPQENDEIDQETQETPSPPQVTETTNEEENIEETNSNTKNGCFIS